MGVFSNKRDGANVKWWPVSLSLRNTLAPRRCRWRCWTDFFRLFSCSRCKLCNRKKNIDILLFDDDDDWLTVGDDSGDGDDDGDGGDDDVGSGVVVVVDVAVDIVCMSNVIEDDGDDGIDVS